jgi:hypothetical protein
VVIVEDAMLSSTVRDKEITIKLICFQGDI